MSSSLALPLPQRGRYEGLMLTLLRPGEALSRSAISNITGLSPTTVTKAVAPLITKGYVEETGSYTETRIGRPAIGLRLVPEAATVCGIQLGVGTARAGLVDALGRASLVRTFSFDPEATAETVTAEIAEQVRAELLPHATSEVIGVGIGAPGAVDAANRISLLSVNLGWREVPIARITEDVCRLPAVVEHNVRAMALAENRFGYGERSIAFVYVRTGVGLGLVLQDEPFLGGEHGVSELGHIQVASRGDRCPCGAYGCLETFVAEPALTRRLAQLGLAGGADPLAVIETAAATDDGVADLRDRVLRHLATGLASTVNLLNPALVVVGGMLGDASTTFLADLTGLTRNRVFPLLRDSLRLERTSFGENAGIVGAAATALETFYYGPSTHASRAGHGRVVAGLR